MNQNGDNEGGGVADAADSTALLQQPPSADLGDSMRRNDDPNGTTSTAVDDNVNEDDDKTVDSVDLRWNAECSDDDSEDCYEYESTGDTPEKAQTWLSDLCHALRRNDTDRTEIFPPDPCPDNFYRGMGAALRDNTIVQKITLDLAAVKSDELNEVNDLLHFLRSSPKLKEAALKTQVEPEPDDSQEEQDAGEVNFSNATRPMLAALASNPHGQLQVLQLQDHENYPFDGLAHLLRVTRSLEWLKLELCEDHDLTSIDDLARGLGENETLQSFELLVGADVTSDFVSPLIRQMRLNKKLPLQRLQLDMSGSRSDRRLVAQFEELSLLLITPPALCVLEGLVFVGVRIETKEMEHLVQGLLASRSVSHLSFQECHFDHGASLAFERFMQTPTSNVPHNVLRELDVRTEFFDATAIMTMPQARVDPDGDSGGRVRREAPSVEATATSNEEAPPTIGMSLHSLSIRRLGLSYVDSSFFPTLAANASRIALQRLRIVELDDEMAHLDCLRHLVHLRMLYLEEVKIQISLNRYLHRFAEELKHNASLQAVVVSSTTSDVPWARGHRSTTMILPHEVPRGHIRNICRRNRALVARQADPRLWRSDANEQAANGNHDMATTAVLHHVPRGFANTPLSAQPSVMISCLMAYPETISELEEDTSQGGNRSGTGKRIRSSSDNCEEPASQQVKTDTN